MPIIGVKLPNLVKASRLDPLSPLHSGCVQAAPSPVSRQDSPGSLRGVKQLCFSIFDLKIVCFIAGFILCRKAYVPGLLKAIRYTTSIYI